MAAAGMTPPVQELTEEAITTMQKIIGRFKKEFGSGCNWDDVPKPVDSSPAEQNKVLIATFGLCVRQLIVDPGMLDRAKTIPELISIARAAEEFKGGMS